MNTIQDAQYDFVVVGGGSAGCIVAKRLVELTKGTVALIEAGPIDEGAPEILDLGLLDQQSEETEWGFIASTDKGHTREITYSRAKMLGGCGNHNDCAFVPPLDFDLDRWVAKGALGWNSVSLFDAMARVRAQVGSEFQKDLHPVSRSLIDAGIALGIPEVDFSTGIQNGVGKFPMNIDGRFRQSSSVAYLHPISDLPSRLNIFANTFVEKLIFEGHQAVGCQTSNGPIMAANAVVLTAGAIQTPQLLMVSGIGPAAELRRFGIDCRVDLEGVGQNLQDHCSSSIVLSLDSPVKDWFTTPYEATLMTSLKSASVFPDVLFHFGLRVCDMNGRNSREESTQATSEYQVKLEPNVMRPLSRGSVTLESDSMHTPPNISLGFLSDREGNDINTLVEATRFAVRLADTEPFRKLGAKVIAPTEHELSDTEHLCQYIKRTCETVYHACGTCRIGLPDTNAVVDSNLSVFNTSGLYIADASTFPEIVSGNIHMTVMMVAEQAASLLAGEYTS